MTSAVEHPDTRERLLEAAGWEFAENGFFGSRVRTICDRADSNVAAVNYHFGDKATLYQTALRHWLEYAWSVYPPDAGVTDDTPAEERLRVLVRSVLSRLLIPGDAALAARMLVWEMARPTGAMDEMTDEVLGPQFEMFVRCLREISENRLNAKTLRRMAWGLVGECFIYHTGRHVMARLDGPPNWTPERVDGLTTHIMDTTLAAIRDRIEEE